MKLFPYLNDSESALGLGGCAAEILDATLDITKADAVSDKTACGDDEDCVPDCLGEWGGSAYFDECGQCVGGIPVPRRVVAVMERSML